MLVSFRYRYPEVEVQEDPELLPQATLITTSLRECCLVEGSSNSVRVSLRLGQATACQESLQKVREITFPVLNIAFQIEL